MTLLSRASLRLMLIVPYVVLVLAAAAVIGVLSYRAGAEAVDTLSDRVLSETVNRIAQAVEQHVSNSAAVLETAFPADIPAPVSVKAELDALRMRFWVATTVHRVPNNYAYYGDRRGQFIGLWRFSDTEAELRVRTEGDSKRSIYRYAKIRGELGDAVPEDRVFDPRERPWYRTAAGSNTPVWTPIYIDFRTLQLVGTLARRVNNGSGEFEGVVATDLSLEHLNEFLKGLKLSANGYAFIVEPDGNLVATSRGPHLRKGSGEDNARLNAAASDDAMIAAGYKSVRALAVGTETAHGTSTVSFVGPDGGTVQAGYARVRDAAGLDWIVIVAVPRSDFMHKVTENVHWTAWMALLASLLIAGIGYAVLSMIARNLRRLATAARQMGEGVIDAQIPVERTDEIGDLARSFAGMQKQLLTDRLTGIANREAIVRRIEDRIVKQRRRRDHLPFALLFVDLNGFKQVNDRFGHDVGDAVLQEFAQRLAASTRDTDLAARFGGDEFVVFLENVANRADANKAREKLEETIAAPLKALEGLAPDPSVIKVGGAIGIALCPEEGNDMETLLKKADEEMYQRKLASRAARQ